MGQTQAGRYRVVFAPATHTLHRTATHQWLSTAPSMAPTSISILSALMRHSSQLGPPSNSNVRLAAGPVPGAAAASRAAPGPAPPSCGNGPGIDPGAVASEACDELEGELGVAVSSRDRPCPAKSARRKSKLSRLLLPDRRRWGWG